MRTTKAPHLLPRVLCDSVLVLVIITAIFLLAQSNIMTVRADNARAEAE